MVGKGIYQGLKLIAEAMNLRTDAEYKKASAIVELANSVGMVDYTIRDLEVKLFQYLEDRNRKSEK